MKAGHVFKFSSFIMKNKEVPYIVKNKVRESALMSALFYGCESWLCNDLRAAETVHATTLKLMLGVRISTSNDLVCIEANTCSASAIIKERQCKFFKKLQSRSDFENSQLHFTIEQAKTVKAPMGVYLSKLDMDINHANNWINDTKTRINQATTTRLATYRCLNPTLQYCDLYTSMIIPEYKRIACTRLRLSSHRLKIETGRWSRIPREDRMCDCGMAVQTEEHVLLHCPSTLHPRESYGPALTCNSAAELYDTADDWASLATFCHAVYTITHK